MSVIDIQSETDVAECRTQQRVDNPAREETDHLKEQAEIVVHGYQSKDKLCTPACKANGRDVTFPNGQKLANNNQIVIYEMPLKWMSSDATENPLVELGTFDNRRIVRSCFAPKSSQLIVYLTPGSMSRTLSFSVM